MFEQINILFVGIQDLPYTVIPTLLGSNYGVRGHLWSQNNVIISMLKADSHLKLYLTSIQGDFTDISNLFYLSAYPSDGPRGAYYVSSVKLRTCVL